VWDNFQDHPATFGGPSFFNDLNPSPNNVTNTTWLAEQRVLHGTQKKGMPIFYDEYQSLMVALGFWTTSWANSAAFLPF
jgi:hypothetical protein